MNEGHAETTALEKYWAKETSLLDTLEGVLISILFHGRIVAPTLATAAQIITALPEGDTSLQIDALERLINVHRLRAWIFGLNTAETVHQPLPGSTLSLTALVDQIVANASAQRTAA